MADSGLDVIIETEDGLSQLPFSTRLNFLAIWARNLYGIISQYLNIFIKFISTGHYCSAVIVVSINVLDRFDGSACVR